MCICVDVSVDREIFLMLVFIADAVFDGLTG